MAVGIPRDPKAFIKGLVKFQEILNESHPNHGLDIMEQLKLYESHSKHGLDAYRQTADAEERAAKVLLDAEKLNIDKARLAVEQSKANSGSFGKRVLTTAAALPVAGLLIGGGQYAMNKLHEIRQIAGLKDPLSQLAMKKGLDRAVKGNYELQSIDPKLLQHRAEMIYASSKTLFDPENTEVLRNLLLSIKGFDGGSLSVLKEIAETEKAMKAHNLGVKDLVNVGSEIF